MKMSILLKIEWKGDCMYDFLDIIVADRSNKKEKRFEVYPGFKIVQNDLMIKGGDFYAFWNEKLGSWCNDQNELIRVIDELVDKRADELKEKYGEDTVVNRKHMDDNDNGIFNKYAKYCKTVPDHWHQLDDRIIFASDQIKKEDYSANRLSYDMNEGDMSAYEELVSTLYEPSERRKFEWAIGSIIAGDSKTIQKFYVFYGTAGSGKSTILDIIELLFPGYFCHFKSEELGNGNNSFALESLKKNTLISIDHEGKLDRIDNNTVLNSVVSHDTIPVNLKFTRIYQARFTTTLFIGSNNPVKITDSKSGLIRRLIDIHPSGRVLPFERYIELKEKIQFELGAIATHCYKVYKKFGKNFYGNYKPTSMISETNDMYNFVSEMLWEWEDANEVSLASAWIAYTKWCDDARIKPYMKRKFKAELATYFDEFILRSGQNVNVYRGIKFDKFGYDIPKQKEEYDNWLKLESCHSGDSIFDKECKDCYAQYTNEDETPLKGWKSVTSRLREIDTNELHYVKVPENHVVIDFDIKGEDGTKDLELNLKAANKFPKTYAELSKGGAGLHLHYIYTGDVNLLSSIYDDGIEVKVFRGGAALRRKLTKCNDIPIAFIGSGLPLREEKPMVGKETIESEKHLIAKIRKCLAKEHHGHTAPEINYIKFLTDQAYAKEGLSYDVRTLRPAIVSFAMNSTNQAQKCFDIASTIHYCSKDVEESETVNLKARDNIGQDDWLKAPIVFFDVEVFPNLFIICWKVLGSNNVVRMINPSPKEVGELFKYRLVGFNNRRYDNHIVYARYMGYSIEELYKLSQRIVSGSGNNAFLGNAYNISYTDIYDYCSNANKMGLKKWEIKLGIYHLENAYRWDKPVPEDKWNEIADYCCNDVNATEAVWNATQSDFKGRLILARLSGLSVNDTSNNHTQQIIFGDDRHPQNQFNCPDLSIEFPGYKFENGKSTYQDENVSEGGWVFFKPGMYRRVKCFDISGMHPHSAYAMKIFGEYYTERYYDLVRARTYIKHKEYDKVRKMFDGKLAEFLENDDDAKALSSALKTPINSVYGLTIAHFDNRCRDPRNKDNIVAKRGALFMITLKHEVDKMGYEVIHCKTDSIKIVDPDEKIEKFIMDFGKKYGYDFEVEDVFDRICLVNGSTFIAFTPEGKWEAKAAQFAHPYVFKTLFSKEDLEFSDFCETKNVAKGALYLDHNESLPDVREYEKQLKKVMKEDPNNKAEIEKLNDIIVTGHDYKFVGKIGLFTPMIDGVGAGNLVVKKDPDIEKYDSVNGAKGYRWYESDFVKTNDLTDKIDMSYFENLVDDAVKAIDKYGDFDIFANGSKEEFESYMDAMIDPDYFYYTKEQVA